MQHDSQYAEQQESPSKQRWEFAEPRQRFEPIANTVFGERKMPMDPALRKTLKFRAVTLLTTLGVAWLLTGNPVTSIGLTAIQQSTNTVVYYIFEKKEKGAK